MIYFTYFFITLFISLFRHQKSERITCLIITLFVFCFSYPSGNDWIGYFLNYDCIQNGQCDENTPSFEPGFNLIVYIFGNLGFLGYNIIIVIFNIYCLDKFSKQFENKAFIYFSMLSFMYWMLYVEAVRQSIAISLLLLAIPFLFKRKIINYILLVLLASTVHTTAIICILFVLPVISPRISKLSSISTLVLSLAFLFVPFIILNIAFSLLQPGSLAYEKLNFYLTSEVYRPQLSAGVGTLFDLILIVLVYLCYKGLKRKKDESVLLHLNLILPGVILYISFSIIIGKMMPVMTRIGWYGLPFIIILLNTKISDSVYFEKIKSTASFPVTKLMIYLFLIAQAARPMIYEHSRYGIINQETIFQAANYLNDDGLYIRAKQKCAVLHTMGLEFLCSI
ncbi:EpsG family protein [Pantoea stewartii]|uniref:EpsG family protein n=1 Tax=Pantoea stewartii TaxID=66269 RepID=UPI00197E5398|nr:EpsG family protein [Pantoea stewartii]